MTTTEEFYRKVRDMRENQKSYFKFRQRTALMDSKKDEAEVDRMLEEYFGEKEKEQVVDDMPKLF